MPKGIYITAEEAAQLLSKRLGRDIPAGYMYKLAHRKKNPVRTQMMGNRFLYHRGDLQTVDIRERTDKESINAPTNAETEE